jgi:hypothetical protein
LTELSERNRYRLEIEMQSGDTIRIEAGQFSIKSLILDSGS